MRGLADITEDLGTEAAFGFAQMPLPKETQSQETVPEGPLLTKLSPWPQPVLPESQPEPEGGPAPAHSCLGPTPWALQEVGGGGQYLVAGCGSGAGPPGGGLQVSPVT